MRPPVCCISQQVYLILNDTFKTETVLMLARWRNGVRIFIILCLSTWMRRHTSWPHQREEPRGKTQFRSRSLEDWSDNHWHQWVGLTRWSKTLGGFNWSYRLSWWCSLLQLWLCYPKADSGHDLLYVECGRQETGRWTSTPSHVTHEYEGSGGETSQFAKSTKAKSHTKSEPEL